MKSIWITIIALSLGGPPAEAQTLGEWIRPKKTQREYLVQQLLANQSLVATLRTGYRVAQYGLQIVWLGKSEELKLHQYFFHALKKINPKVLEYGRVTDFMLMQIRLIQQARKLKQNFRAQGEVGGDHVGEVSDRMIRASENLLSELLVTISAGELALTDDQRIQRIDVLYNDMTILIEAFKSFSTDANGLIEAQKRVERETNTIQDWYGLKGGNDEV